MVCASVLEDNPRAKARGLSSYTDTHRPYSVTHGLSSHTDAAMTFLSNQHAFKLGRRQRSGNGTIKCHT